VLKEVLAVHRADHYPLLLPVEALSQDQAAGIAGVVAPGTTVELVKEGFQFTEGPVGTPDGGLYFTDVRASIMYRLHPSGDINVFRDNTAAAGGLAFDRAGNLLAVEAEGKRIIRIDSRGGCRSSRSPGGRGSDISETQ